MHGCKVVQSLYFKFTSLPQQWWWYTFNGTKRRLLLRRFCEMQDTNSVSMEREWMGPCCVWKCPRNWRYTTEKVSRKAHRHWVQETEDWDWGIIDQQSTIIHSMRLSYVHLSPVWLRYTIYRTHAPWSMAMQYISDYQALSTTLYLLHKIQAYLCKSLCTDILFLYICGQGSPWEPKQHLNYKSIEIFLRLTLIHYRINCFLWRSVLAFTCIGVTISPVL